MQTVWTIAGFDPSSGAGLTADLAVFAAHGLFGAACATALTVQTTLGVRSVHPVEAGVVAETLEALRVDLPPVGIKIGMLANGITVATVASFLASLKAETSQVKVVLDPVIRSSSGRALLSTEGVAVLRDKLLPLVDWTTPNLAELAALTGMPVTDRQEMLAAAMHLRSIYPGLHVVATGGHLDRPDDLVMGGDGTAWVRGERMESRATHGTGCAYSSALLCGLVAGKTGVESARSAKDYVVEAIRTAQPLGRGVGPMNLYWPLCGEARNTEATPPLREG